MENKKSKKKSSNVFYIIIIFILLGSLGVLGWKYYELKQEKSEDVAELEEINKEKNLLTLQLNDLLVEYETIQTDNDSLNVQLEAEQEKIKKIIKEIKQIKATNKYEITMYKKELGTLRKIMRSFIVQIDSLNTLNIELTAENIQVKRDYQQSKDKYEELSQENIELSDIVEKASAIKAYNIHALPLNKKSKKVYKLKRVTKIRVCFTLSENVIAESGWQDVFIRISRPDELVLAASEDDLFSFEGEKIVYTEKRGVDYQNIDVDLCIYWNKNQELIPGIYYVDIFSGGKEIGTTTFELK